MLVISIIRIKT